MQPLRFLIYCLSAASGIVGLAWGGIPLLSYLVHRFILRSYHTEPDLLFREAVIFFLSLILLLLVHIGYRIAGGFDMSVSKKPEAREAAKESEA